MEPRSFDRNKHYDILLISIQRLSLVTNSKKSDGLNRLPPLGPMYLSSYLTKGDFKAKILDVPLNELDKIVKWIKEHDIKVVSFTSCAATIEIIKDILRKSKTTFNNKIIILGGVHASAMPEACLKEIKEVDFLVVGEGEKILSQLLKNLKEIGYKKTSIGKIKEKLDEIDGLCYRIGNKTRINKKPSVVKNLDDIPIPERDSIDKYVPPPNQYKKLPIAHIITSRGCNFKCTYCSIGNTSSKARYRSISNVTKEIKYLLGLGAKEVHIWDECFTTNYARVEQFCKEIVKQKINFLWSCFSRTDTVDEGLLRLMKSAGCWCIFYGIESANEEQLKLINKNISLEKAEEIIKITKKCNGSQNAYYFIYNEL